MVTDVSFRMLGDELRALRVLKPRPRPFTFVSERGAPFTVAGLTKPIERAGVASAAIELHRRQLASPARCGRLLAQTNPASAVMPTLRLGGPRRGGVSRIRPGTNRPKHSPQQLASPARSAAGHKQTRLCGHADPPPRRTRRGGVSRIRPGTNRPKHSPQQLASPARSAAGHKQTRLCGHADPPP